MKAKQATGGNNKTKNPNVQLCPNGLRRGRIVSIIDLGTQQVEYKGKVNPKPMISITLEISDWKQLFYLEDEGPRVQVITKDFTFYMNDKANLRKFVEGFTGTLTDKEAEEYDIENLLNKPLYINVSTKTSKQGKQYNIVQSISPLPQGVEALPAENDPVLFELDEGVGVSTKEFVTLPKWIRDKILESEEVKQYLNTGGVVAKYEDFYSTDTDETETDANTNRGPQKPAEFQQQQQTQATNQVDEFDDEDFGDIPF